MPACYALFPWGLQLRLKVQPKSRREGPQGLIEEPSGELVLKFGTNAAPEDGKANAAVVALLAKHLPVAKTAISVVAGAKARRKLVDILGDPAALAGAMDSWLSASQSEKVE